MSVSETARRLNVSRSTVKRWANDGRLNAQKVGGQWLIELDDGPPNERPDAQSERSPAGDLAQQVGVLNERVEQLTAQLKAAQKERDDWKAQADQLHERLREAHLLTAQEQQRAIPERAESQQPRRSFWDRILGRGEEQQSTDVTE